MFIRHNNGGYRNHSAVCVGWGRNIFTYCATFRNIFDTYTGKSNDIIEGIFWIMTKLEYEKCEKLMYNAILKAGSAHKGYKAYKWLHKEGREVDAEWKRRVADQEFGYADGINQVLATLGFKHDRMKELSKLL